MDSSVSVLGSVTYAVIEGRVYDMVQFRGNKSINQTGRLMIAEK